MEARTSTMVVHDPKEAIPLIRIASTTSTSYPPSYYTRNTQATLPLYPNSTASFTTCRSAQNFTPTRTLQIQASGKSPIFCPTYAKQLEIPIFDDAGTLVYQSIRPTRSKGNCRLVRADDETESSIATTTYWFGPGKQPQIRIFRDDEADGESDTLQLTPKSLVSRTRKFESKWGTFEWRYAGKTERGKAINSLLVLEKILDGGKRLPVARLVRSDTTRTPGTKAMYAGNGGKLEMCLRDGIDGEDGTELINEATVVVTCLVMLKKEIDRLRAIQITYLTIVVL